MVVVVLLLLLMMMMMMMMRGRTKNGVHDNAQWGPLDPFWWSK